MSDSVTTKEKSEPVASAPIGILLDRQNPLDWSLFADFLVRVREFCKRYDPETDVDILTDQLMQDFGGRDERLFAAAVVLLDGEIVGHGLITLEGWGYKRVAIALQMEFDEGVTIPHDSLEQFYGQLEDWARLNRCTAIHAFVKDEVHARRLEVFYGFHKFKFLMRKDLVK